MATQTNAATQLQDHLTGKIRVEFPVPYDTPNGKLATLTFRRGKVRDQKRAQLAAPGDPMQQEMLLITYLVDEVVTIEDLEELDLGDYAEIQRVFSLLMRQRRCEDAAPGQGTAGEVVRNAALGDR
jgi:hypothetical protein